MTAQYDGDQREEDRLAELDRYQVLDSVPEAAFDDLVQAASAVAGMPAAAVSLVDEHRQWFKAVVGMEGPGTPRDVAFCDLVVRDDDELVVGDTLLEPRLAANPDVVGGPRFRFYAGFPLRTPAGAVLGTLCVLDHEPRALSDVQCDLLRTLARQAMAQLELRREVRERDLLIAQRAEMFARLEASQERYRFLVENSTDVIAQHRLDGSVIYVSPTVQDLLGVTPHTPEDWNLDERLHPDDTENFTGAWFSALAGETATAGGRMRHEDGGYRHLEITMKPVKDESGTVVELIATTRDATQRQQAAEVLARTRESLARQSELLELAQESAGMGSWATDLRTQEVVWSREAHRLLGSDPDMPLDTETIWRYVHPDDHETVRAVLNSTFSVGRSDDVEYRVIRQDGQTRTLRSRFRVDRDPSGVALRLSGILRDVTETRETELELVRATDLLEQVIATATRTAVIGVGLDGLITVFNRGAQIMLGYSAEEMIGTRGYMVFHDLDEVAERSIRLGLQPGDSQVFVRATDLGDDEWTLTRKDGDRIHGQLSVSMLTDTEGQPTGYIGFLDDVTETRRTRQELVEAKDLFDQLLHSATEQAIICSDLSGTITIFNRGAERMLGLSAAELIGTKDWNRWLEPGRDAVVLDAFRQIRAGAIEVRTDSNWIRSDGIRLTVHIVLSPMRRHDGELSGFVGFASDVTEQRRAEADLAAATAELVERREQMEEAQRLALIGSWSLDLRTEQVIWSPEMYRLCGADPATLTLTPTTFQGFIHPDDLPRLVAAIGPIDAGTGPFVIEHRMIGADGQERLVMTRGQVETGEDGTPIRLRGAAQDITQHRQMEADLVRANDLFNQLLSSATAQAIIGTDADGVVTIFNRGAEKMLGYTAEEIVGTPNWRHFHDPGELQKWSDQFASGVHTVPPQDEAADPPDWTFVRKDGQRLTVQIRLSPMRNPAGETVGFVSVATDVTKQRQAEAALAQANADVALRSVQLEEAQQIAAVGSWSRDLITGDTVWTTELYRILGEDLESVEPGPAAFRERIHPEDLEWVTQTIGQAQVTGSAWSSEHRIRLASGQVKEVLNRGRAESGSSGAIIRIGGILQDVTQVRQAQREALVARDQFMQLLSAATDQAIIGTDQAGVINLFNKGAERMTGFTLEDAIGKTRWALLHDPEEVARRRGDAPAPGSSPLTSDADRSLMDADREWTWIRKDRRRITVQVSLTPMLDQDGEISGILGISSDVTEQRAVERERDRAEQDVQAAVLAISQARDEALAANQAKSAFLATMSHEIRTPMNAVIGMTGLLLDTHLDDEQRDLIETVRGSGDQLLAIINDILDFSKIEAGDLDLEARAFDLRDLVEGTIAQFAGSAQGLDLISHVDAGCPASVVGDVTRLRQVLSNLIGNAIKFTAAGDVLVRVGCDATLDGSQRLHFQVRDTGIGIPAESMDRLFRSFSQVDASTTRNYGGTGLGLAISKALVQAMGGDIWVESELGRGSTFSFTVVVGADTSVPENPPGRMTPDELRQALEGRRVLIVDDSETNRRIFTLQLSAHGMQTVDVASPIDALHLLSDASQHLDLVILDLAMPVLDGVQLAQAIRRLPLRADVPLMLLASIGRRLDEGQELLFTSVLTKPVRSLALVENTARALRPAHHEARADPPPASVQRPAPADGADGADRPVRIPAPGPGADAKPPEELPATRRLRILLAEDNEVNQKVGRLMLARMGHSAEIVANGEQALAAAIENDYDVVLMDMHMPVMDGLEATRRIRAELPRERQPWIVALTASVTVEDREACSAAGMDAYLSKPVRPYELASTIAAATEVDHG